MTEAVIYARYSPTGKRPRLTRAGGDKAMQSALLQTEALRAYCAAHDWNVLGEFADEYKSGKSLKGRSGFEQAVRVAMRERATLCVYSLSRFGRSIRDSVNTVYDLRNSGANLFVLKEQFDSTTYQGRLMFHMLAAIAEVEREMISERTKDAMRRMQVNGLLVGRPDRPPYGWKAVNVPTEDGTDTVWILQPDEDEQDMLSHLLSYYAECQRPGAVACRLNSEGIFKRGGKPWKWLDIVRIMRRIDEHIANWDEFRDKYPSNALRLPGPKRRAKMPMDWQASAAVE